MWDFLFKSKVTFFIEFLSQGDVTIKQWFKRKIFWLLQHPTFFLSGFLSRSDITIKHHFVSKIQIFHICCRYNNISLALLSGLLSVEMINNEAFGFVFSSLSLISEHFCRFNPRVFFRLKSFATPIHRKSRKETSSWCTSACCSHLPNHHAFLNYFEILCTHMRMRVHTHRGRERETQKHTQIYTNTETLTHTKHI